MAKMWKIALPVLLLLAAMVAAALYRGLVVRRYRISTTKLPVGERLRLVFLADLHCTLHGKDQSALLDLIAEQKPDAILLGGDIVDDVRPMANALTLLAGLRALGVPTYYVSGNHELWRNDYPDVKRIVESYGIAVLDGDFAELGPVRLCGIGDPSGYGNYEKALANAFAGLRDDRFNVLFAHRPERIEQYRKYPFDLVLAGHAHGGQVRIPLILNGLFAPNQGLFPKYAGGEYRIGGTAMIVSRGLSHYPRLPRVFNPPEVVVVDIEGAQ
ncbi:MAG: metallophosphoesterase [Clostridiales bacterium]|jgi:predicted MPP superfamily phosphohydrolase|nr:metallophosphoesterase [Clostridiales bacterium]OPZ67641.1 MAG: putative metallophosphoesterase [Firmicutes bacterium ADurb.Bin467]